MVPMYSTRSNFCSTCTAILIFSIITGFSACTSPQNPPSVEPSSSGLQSQTSNSLGALSTPLLATPFFTTPLPSVYHQPGPVEIPILLYHHIATNPQDKRYYVDPLIFAEQMTG